MIVRIVADAHGHWRSVHQMAVEAVGVADVILIAGDAGFGFPQSFNPPYGLEFPLPMWYLRGNHDNPEVAMHWPGWSHVRDGARIGNAVFIGGGHSIDKASRSLGWTGGLGRR
jgi:hypothetical protein